MAESVIGEVTEKTSSFKEITWRINKLFSLACEAGYKVRSPPFYFAGVNCNLSVRPNGTNRTTSGEVIVSLFLRMMDWKHESPPVICEVGLKSNNGALVKNPVAEKNLKDGVFITCSFKKSEILKNIDLLDSEENHTIYCKLTIGENSRLDEATQTENQIKCSSGEWVFPETKNGIDISCPTDVYVQTEQRGMGVERVLHDFKKLLESEDDTDATIKIKEREFKVHRGILGTRTPVFAAMFKHDMSEKTTGYVSLNDCEPDIFQKFLHYVYTGTVDCLSRENVFSLYEISHKYQVEDLKEECLDCLKEILCVDTFCDVISLSLKYEEKELLTLTTKLFCEKMSEIIVTVQWQSFIKENPSYVNELLIKRIEYEAKHSVL